MLYSVMSDDKYIWLHSILSNFITSWSSSATGTTNCAACHKQMVGGHQEPLWRGTGLQSLAGAPVMLIH